MKSINKHVRQSKTFLLCLMLIFISICTTIGQTQIFFDGGPYTYVDTDTITEDVFAGINISSCSSIQINLEYSFSLPWEGSGNMESQDECGNCNGDPLNQNSDCLFPPNGCWDFLFVRIILDGSVVDAELIGETGTTDTEQSGTISFTECINSESVLEIEVYTQTWTPSESVTFSNIEVLCWDDQPIASAVPNPVCENQDVQLDELNGNFTSWSWSGPSGYSSGTRDPLITSFNSANVGIYMVTVEDVNGCIATDEVEVLLNQAPAINTGLSLEGCGPPPATIDLTQLQPQLNSDPSLVFDWYEDPNASVVISNPSSYSSSGGSVYVSITDPVTSCTSDTVAVDLMILPQPSFSVPSDVTVCEGLTVDLDTVINPTNTNLNYTYHDGVPPTPANQISDITSFNNNTVISVVGTDANNCSDTQYVNLQTIEVPLAPPASNTGPYCEGDDIILEADPPVLPFLTYIWTGPNGYMATGPNQTIPNATLGDAGIYELTATFAGCTSQPTAIDVIVNPTPSAPVVNDPLSVCYGDSLFLDAESDPGSQYSWVGPGGFFTSDKNPLVTPQANYSFEGVYTVTPTLNGCQGPSTSLTVDVLDSPDITLQLDQEILCVGGSSGAISVIINNAPAPFEFDWSNNIYDGMSSLSGLSEGTYSVTVTDGNGCRSAGSITLQDPVPINLFCEQENPVSSGGAEDGVGNIFIGGGNPPYELMYDNGMGNNGTLSGLSEGNTLISNLAEGTYQVNVTDDNGCAASCQFTISTNACDLTISSIIQIDSILCNGDSSASLEVSVSMGSGNYIYQWEDTLGNIISDSSIALGLVAGIYYISVEDANDTSCTEISQMLVSQPPLLEIISCTENTAPSFPGAEDGQALVRWTGGMGPYTLIMSGPSSDTTVINTDSLFLDSLPEGNYSVIIQDSNNCMDSCTFRIQSSNCDLSIDLDTAYFTACPSDSSLVISLSVMNQSINTIYIWNGDTLDQSSTSGLSEGIYRIMALDTLTGCFELLELDLSYDSPPDFICTVLQQPSSPDSTDGIAEVIFSSILKPYDLILKGPDSSTINSGLEQDTFEIANLSSGNYTAVVTDSLGCMDSCIFNLISGTCDLSLTLDTAFFDACPEDSSLIILVSANVPDSQLIYRINDDTSSIGEFNGLPEGIYIIIADDTLTGCSDTLTIDRNFTSIRSFTCEIFSPPSAVGSRNGIGGIIVDSISKPYSVLITSFNYSSNRTGLSEDTIRFNDLDSGLYLVTITDSLGCTDTCSFIMPDGGCEIFSIDSIVARQPSCANGLNGEIQVFVSGGSGNYNFDWNIDSLDGNSLITNLGPGTYGITVTDNDLGCRVQGQRTLFPAEDIEVNLSFMSSFCEGDSVEITLNIQDGQPPFTAQLGNDNPFMFSSDTSIWSNMEGPAIEITDANGCTQYDTLDIAMLDRITSNLDTTLCPGETLEIENEVFDQNRRTGLVVLENAAMNGCDSIINVDVTIQDPMLDFEILDPSCLTNQNSRIQLTSWSEQGAFTVYIGGQTFAVSQLPYIIEDLESGSHEIYAESALQCRTDTQTVEVEERRQLEVNINDVGTIEAGDSVLLEGVTTFDFSNANWMPSSFVRCDTCLSTLAYPTITTTFTLTIEDSMGCSGEATVTVIVAENDMAWYIPNTFSPNGDGINDHFTIYGNPENGHVDHFLIFNRWGDLLFENRAMAIGIEKVGWDGTSGGREMDPGVYIYSFELTTSDGEKLYFKGSVTLLK